MKNMLLMLISNFNDKKNGIFEKIKGIETKKPLNNLEVFSEVPSGFEPL